MLVHTFQKHPEEGSKMEVSEDDMTDTPDVDDNPEVICPYKVLKQIGS